ncbi:hypothetical protein C7974DRAFT_428703 [Boeremia exigua]|uniref:uncharacterized protein n=1 Tax=Boeremia exigua TaxID=749465 RepID=UPI001E8EE10D|nr:uncharacterized protein C7974DRAFT_428703 [Boeremia exigua]KAH6614317.1 hypothetical protein C7974DRAFT_428703 [Boeremia exigua]
MTQDSYPGADATAPPPQPAPNPPPPYPADAHGLPTHLAFPNDLAAALAHRHRITHPPTLAPHLDPTIPAVAAAQETHVREIVRAIYTTAQIHDNPTSRALRSLQTTPPADAEATARILFAAVLRRCTLGHRGPGNRLLQANARAEAVDRDGTCAVWLANVVGALAAWKSVCKDVLREEGKIEALANAPATVARDKRVQQGNNETKRVNTQRDRAAAGGQAEGGYLPPVGGKRRRRVRVVGGEGSGGFAETFAAQTHPLGTVSDLGLTAPGYGLDALQPQDRFVRPLMSVAAPSPSDAYNFYTANRGPPPVPLHLQNRCQPGVSNPTQDVCSSRLAPPAPLHLPNGYQPGVNNTTQDTSDSGLAPPPVNQYPLYNTSDPDPNFVNTWSPGLFGDAFALHNTDAALTPPPSSYNSPEPFSSAAVSPASTMLAETSSLSRDEGTTKRKRAPTPTPTSEVQEQVRRVKREESENGDEGGDGEGAGFGLDTDWVFCD